MALSFLPAAEHTFAPATLPLRRIFRIFSELGQFPKEGRRHSFLLLRKIPLRGLASCARTTLLPFFLLLPFVLKTHYTNF